jgi:hypothetical protein
MLNTVLTTAVASNIQINYILPIATNSIDTFLTAAAGASTYTVQLAGFYT